MVNRTTLLACTLVLLSGCGAELVRVTAHAIGCPESAVTVSNDQVHALSRTWNARCRGQEYSCESHGAGGTPNGTTLIVALCAQQGAPPSRGGEASSRDASNVARETTPEGTRLASQLSDATFVARLSVVAGSTDAQLTLEPRTSLPSLGTCSVVGVADGTATEWTVSSSSSSSLTVQVPVSTVRAFAAATRASARVCDREWRLSSVAQARLRELVALLDEEEAVLRARQANTQPAED